MTTITEMEEKRKEVLQFIKNKGSVRQTDILKRFKEEFKYVNYTSYRMGMSDILRSLEKRKLIVKKIDKKSTTHIPQNIWELR